LLVILLQSNEFFFQSCNLCIPLNYGSFILEALKRSRKRVRNALQTELPHLISTEFSSNQENEPSIAGGGSTGKTVSEAHIARWRSLFVQMERTLQEEGRQLVSLCIRVFCDVTNIVVLNYYLFSFGVLDI
jgi:hypothetical protein